MQLGSKQNDLGRMLSAFEQGPDDRPPDDSANADWAIAEACTGISAAEPACPVVDLPMYDLKLMPEDFATLKSCDAANGAVVNTYMGLLQVCNRCYSLTTYCYAYYYANLSQGAFTPFVLLTASVSVSLCTLPCRECQFSAWRDDNRPEQTQ